MKNILIILIIIGANCFSQTDKERIEKLEAQLAKADTLILQLMESMTEQKILDIYMDDRIRKCPHKTREEQVRALDRYHRFIYQKANMLDKYIDDYCEWKYKRHFVQDASRKVRESDEPHPIKDIINSLKERLE
jgi:uncharacterized coiled-coil protein SlyX